jgi:hypothetical protein
MALEIAVGLLLNAAPVTVAVLLLVLRDNRGRFGLRWMLMLTASIAVTVWAWAYLLRH